MSTVTVYENDGHGGVKISQVPLTLEMLRAQGTIYVRKLLILQRLAAVGKAEAALAALKADDLQYEMWSAATEIDAADEQVRAMLTAIGADPDEILKPE